MENADQSPVSARKQNAALASIGASVALTLAKLGAGALTGSLALLSEGAHNAVDIAASATTYFAVRVADMPADEDHPFGHAKVEAVAALAETGFLIVLAIGVAIEAVQRLRAPGLVDANALAFGAIFISLVVDWVRWRMLTRVARETGSDALAADALHFSSDLVSSLLVLVGLFATRFGFPYADALAAIGVSLFIGIAGFRLGRRTIDALVDAAPKGLASEVRAAVERASGVAGVDFLRLRRSGPQVVGDLGLFVSRTLPLERVAAIKSDLERALALRWPTMALTLTANPRALDDETILERVQVIAGRRRLFVHHVAIQHIGGRACVSLDLEVDGRSTLGEAHEVASQLETAIKDELGAEIEVETHIEPMETRELHGRDADPQLQSRFVVTLQRYAPQFDLEDVHNIRLRAGENGHFAIFHCRVPPQTTVEAAHQRVDALERAVRLEFPQIRRIVGHAEPVRGA